MRISETEEFGFVTGSNKSPRVRIGKPPANTPKQSDC
jgi:hypothetical protein